MSFGLPDRFIRLYNLSLFLIRRRISWFIHGKPSRVSAFRVVINLSVKMSSDPAMEGLEDVERLCHADLVRKLIPLDNSSWKERKTCNLCQLLIGDID